MANENSCTHTISAHGQIDLRLMRVVFHARNVKFSANNKGFLN
jgi:hypothetical protein